MDKIVDDYENQFLISLLIKILSDVYSQLDMDIGIGNSDSYTFILFLVLLNRISKVHSLRPIKLSFELVAGDIVQGSLVLKDRRWIQVQGFVVDLVNGNQSRSMMEFYPGIVLKLKQDYQTHIKRNYFSLGEIDALKRKIIRLKTGERITAMKYYYKYLA